MTHRAGRALLVTVTCLPEEQGNARLRSEAQTAAALAREGREWGKWERGEGRGRALLKSERGCFRQDQGHARIGDE